MHGEHLPDDLRILWKEVGMNPPKFSPDQLRDEMGRLQAGRRRKYVTGVVAAWILLAAFALCFFAFDNTLTRVGSILWVLVGGLMLVELRRGRARVIPDVGGTDGVRYYRAELERQRDCCRGRRLLPRLLMLVPPWILFNVGFAQIHPELALFMWFDGATLPVAAAVAVWLNSRLARKYQRRIDALDASLKSTE